MSAPTAPTLISLTAEAVQKAGYSATGSQYSALVTRARNEWMNEIKMDIMNVERKLKSLMVTSYQVTADNLATYDFPSDFSSDLNITLLDGSNIGEVQAGGVATVTLASGSGIDDAQILGHEIFILSGTGVNQGRYVTAYDEGTGVATVGASWTTIPAATDTYMVVDTLNELVSAPVWDIDRVSYLVKGIPTHFSPVTNNGVDQYVLYPTPYRATGTPYGLRLRYYADLTTLDLASATMTALYNRWRMVWIQGVYAKCLQWTDDNRAGAEMTTYWNMIRQMVGREKYGNQIQDMQTRVQDYD